MSQYTVEISRQAVKAIAGLERADQLRIRAAIDLLADEPCPPGCTKLTAGTSAYRVRVGDYRIVYDVIDDRLVIQVVRIGHRRDIYRNR
ncbi:type II toxin-antitoxin system RelE family toxin [Candidatus Poriferisodalis sp.]|uniref:type II toxin-antitoxin system RelE family toxin n=1 Tax=Candidatus Poriferisodalis sp. TaxID=3101277 RepID=UPI003B01505F